MEVREVLFQLFANYHALCSGKINNPGKVFYEISKNNKIVCCNHLDSSSCDKSLSTASADVNVIKTVSRQFSV